MSRKLILSAIMILMASVLSAQDAAKFFPKQELIYSGTYYYPDAWPREQWERDIKRIAELGFEFIHMAEFAWGVMEPEEGRYEFEWLDEAVDLSAKYGLKVVLCTPSAIPPAWFSTKYTDELIVDDTGQRIEHGSRQPASWASDLYREYVTKIDTELAKRYGNHPAVWGWQIDNEPSHYKFTYEYSERTQEKFRQWLQNKYTTIDKLNREWGNVFWSQTYNSFDQIRIPNQKVSPGKANPHAVLDYKRYTADEAASFINFQADLLRRYIASRQWITTNTTPTLTAVDPGRMDRLDFVTYTRYQVNGRYDGYGEQGFRISNPELIGWNNDYYRNLKGITGVMEIQPGQVNWGKFNSQTYPGAVRLWYYHIFAGGGSLVCHYRFRQPLKGSEQFHYGMMQTDGVTVSHPGEEIEQFNREVAILRKNYDPKAKMPAKLQKVRTAILFNPDNGWDLDFQPLTEQWSMLSHLNRYYNTIKSFGIPVDVVEENADFASYPVMVAPAYELVDQKLIGRWEEYVKSGGHLILTVRTGQKNRMGHLWEAKLAGPIYGLIGARELFFDHLPRGRKADISFGTKTYQWSSWADVVTPDGTSEIWATYAGQYYKGSAAVLHKKIGKGTITYIGAETIDGALERDVVKNVYEKVGAVSDLPPSILIEWRDGFYVGLNYTSEPYTFDINNKAKIIIGSPTTPAAGVVVWKE